MESRVWRKRVKPNWNLILLLATIGTTLWAGYQFSAPLAQEALLERPWLGAASFSLGLLAILGCHEMGHKVMADKRGVVATFPYFIPVPFFLGTFGAVIRMKSLPQDRNALFDVGAAGPIAGFLALIPISILGISWSFPVRPEGVEGALSLPSPLLFDWLQAYVAAIPAEKDLLLHPLALAGWVGMIVTTLNLLPVAELDGGHVTRALFGQKRHRWVSFGGAALAFALGYWLFGVLVLIFAFKRAHPGPIDDIVPLSSGRRLVSFGLLVMLVLCATPLYQAPS